MLPDHLERIARQQRDMKKRTERLESLGSGAKRLIDPVVLAAPAALITFANISAIYAHLEIWLYTRSDKASSNDDVDMRFNNDVGNNYDYVNGQHIENDTLSMNEALGATFLRVGNIAGGTAPADAFDMYVIKIPAYANTIGEKVINAKGTFKFGEAGSQITDRFCSGWWRSKVAIFEIDLVLGAGDNFVTGSRFDLYGIQGGA